MDAVRETNYRRNIYKAYAFKFLTMFHLFAGVMIPFFTQWGGIRFSQVMVLQAIFTFSAFLLEVPTGAIADRFGRKKSIALAAVVLAVAVVMYSIYPNFWLFAIGEVVWGMGFALLSGADQALLYDTLRELGEESRSKKVLGRWQSFGLFGIAVAAPLGSLIAKYMGLRYAMLLMVFPMIAAAVLAMTIREPEVASEGRQKAWFRSMIDGGRYLAGHKALCVLTFDYISISALSFFIVWVYQVLLGKLGVDIKWFGFVASIMTVMQIVVLNSFTVMDKFFRGKRRYAFATAFLIGAGFIVLGFTSSVAVAVCAMAVVSAFGLTRGPLFQNYMNKFIDSHHRATVLSFTSMLYGLTMAVLNIVLGYMVDWNVSVTVIVIGSMIVMFNIFSRVSEEHLLD